jgi:hypothetical protein
MPNTGTRSKHRKTLRRRSDNLAQTIFQIGLAMLAVCLFVIFGNVLDPGSNDAATESVKPVLYLAGAFMLASIGTKSGVLDIVKSLLGG